MPPERSSGRKLARPRLVDLPAHRLGDADQGEAARVSHDRNDETIVIKINRDAQIDVTRKRQRLAVEARVDLRKAEIARQVARAMNGRNVSENPCAV